MKEDNKIPQKTRGDRLKSPIIALLLAIVSTGLIGDMLNFWDVSIKRNDDYVTRYVECKELYSKLEARVNILELAQGDIPFPYWVKDLEFNIIHISKEYQRTILNPLGIDFSQIIGTKGELMGLEFVQEITFNDAEVIRQNKTISFRETIPNFGTGTSYKFPVRSKYGGIRGIAGIWIPDTLNFITNFK